MGECLIVRRDCGSILGDTLFAIINVTYPEGSACTCTNGTKMLFAKDTSGKYTFVIPEAGTWTVNCFDGADYDSSTNKKSESIEITEGQSASIELFYQNSLVDGDSIDTSVFQTVTADVGVETDDNGENFLRVGYDGSDWTGRGTAYIIADLTNYNTLHIEGCYSIFNNADSNEAGVYIGTGLDEPSSTINFSSDDKETYTLDVSGCGANTYICIFGEAENTDTQGWWSVDACIYNMWLE